MRPENNVGLGSCWITEYLLPYLCMVTVSHIMVGLERMLDYRGVGLARFHCIQKSGLSEAAGVKILYVAWKIPQAFLIHIFAICHTI